MRKENNLLIKLNTKTYVIRLGNGTRTVHADNIDKAMENIGITSNYRAIRTSKSKDKEKYNVEYKSLHDGHGCVYVVEEI